MKNKKHYSTFLIFSILFASQPWLVYGQKSHSRFSDHDNHSSECNSLLSAPTYCCKNERRERPLFFKERGKINKNNQQSMHFSNRLLLNFYGTAIGFGLSFMAINLLSHGSFKTRDNAETWIEKNYEVLTFPLSVLSGSTANMLFTKKDKMKTFLITTGLAGTEMICFGSA